MEQEEISNLAFVCRLRGGVAQMNGQLLQHFVLVAARGVLAIKVLEM